MPHVAWIFRWPERITFSHSVMDSNPFALLKWVGTDSMMLSPFTKEYREIKQLKIYIFTYFALTSFFDLIICQWISLSIISKHMCRSTHTICISSDATSTGYVVYIELIWGCLQVKQGTLRQSTIAFCTQHYILLKWTHLGALIQCSVVAINNWLHYRTKLN